MLKRIRSLLTLYELSVNDFITFLKDFINLLNDDFRIKYLKFYSFALVFSPPPKKRPSTETCTCTRLYSTMPMYRNVHLDLYVCRLNDCCPANGLTDADYKCLMQCSLHTWGIIKGFFSFFRDAMFHKFSKLKASNIFFMMI